MAEIEKVTTAKDALLWFEEELRNGKCSPDCPQCNAYEWAITALQEQGATKAYKTMADKNREAARKFQSQKDKLQTELKRAKKENRELIDYLKKLRMVSGVYCPKCGDALELEVINGEPAIGCFGCDEYWPVKEILSDAKMDGKDDAPLNISREDQKLIDEFIERARERDEGESSMDYDELIKKLHTASADGSWNTLSDYARKAAVAIETLLGKLYGTY